MKIYLHLHAESLKQLLLMTYPLINLADHTSWWQLKIVHRALAFDLLVFTCSLYVENPSNGMVRSLKKLHCPDTDGQSEIFTMHYKTHALWRLLTLPAQHTATLAAWVLTHLKFRYEKGD